MTTDPITLAREVLDSAKYAESRFMSISDMPSIGRAAPDLARAVIDLTAKAERVKALADQYDAWAREEMREGDVNESLHTQTTADRIRAALNGDTND